MDQTLLEDAKLRHDQEHAVNGEKEHGQLGMLDKPRPCFGCGIGWFCFLLGFVFPLLWYYASVLYFGSYYRKDPRERTGLAANAIAGLIFTVAVLITLAAVFL